MSSELKALHARLERAKVKVRDIEALIKRREEAEAEPTPSSERRARAKDQASAMLEMRDNGAKWADVALAYGLSTSSAREIVEDERRRKERD